MTKKSPILKPELGMKVFHETIYNGKECMRVVGIRFTEVELEGDYSGGTHPSVSSSWMTITGLFRLRKVCNQVEKYGSCQLNNIQCNYPACEPYLESDHHYENGLKINH